CRRDLHAGKWREWFGKLVAGSLPRSAGRGETKRERAHTGAAIDDLPGDVTGQDLIVVVPAVRRVDRRTAVSLQVVRHGNPRRERSSLPEAVSEAISSGRGDVVGGIRPELPLVAQARLDHQLLPEPPVVLPEDRDITLGERVLRIAVALDVGRRQASLEGLHRRDGL